MHFRIYIGVMILLAGMVACKKENMCDCVKSTGPTNVIYHDVSNFTCIDIKDKINVFLTQGSTYEVKVEAGRNLQSLIKAKVDGDTLHVFNANRCNWVRGYKHEINVYITAPYFKYILHNGVGPIKTLNRIVQDTLTCRTNNSGELRLDADIGVLMCSSHGNGDIYLSGKTNNLQDDYTGTNFLYAADLEVKQYIYLHSVSIGHAYVNAPSGGVMDIQLDRSGNIYYKGNPGQINLKKMGKGELIQE